MAIKDSTIYIYETALKLNKLLQSLCNKKKMLRKNIIPCHKKDCMANSFILIFCIYILKKERGDIKGLL